MKFFRCHALDRAFSLVFYGCIAAIAVGGSTVCPLNAQGPSIGFVQVAASTPQTPQTLVSTSFAAAQTAGNLNVIVVGWNDSTARVVSITDTAGNAYALAVGPTVVAGYLSQAIYYAKNINAAAAGANIVNVSFDQAAQYVDLRSAEYRGLDTVTPFDVEAALTGNNASSTSGAVTTLNANDLLVGANIVTTGTQGPGSSYTNRIITIPDSDILEDRIVTAVGSYSATAPLTTIGRWIMQLVAFRAAGSGPPPVDTHPPTAPSALTTTAISPSQINLAWTASTDNVGVTGYLIERCQEASCTTFVQIPATTGTATTFSDTGLNSTTTYQYQVRAKDAAGNFSVYSNISGTTTLSAPDTQPPTAPSGLTATTISGSQINLAWTPSTDNVGVTGYLIERCQGASCTTFAQVAAPAGTATTYSDTALSSATSYRYQVRTMDAAGNFSAYSNISGTTTPDTQPPAAPSALTSTAFSTSQINLAWTASTDNVGVTGYLIERCQGASCTTFAQVAAPAGTATTYSDTGLSPATGYRYQVRATDAAGNFSLYSNISGTTTLSPPDTQPPTAPTGLTATAFSASQINLAWVAATDNVGVTGYLVERCSGAGCSNFAQVGTTVTGTALSDTGLALGTSYTYVVHARDLAGNFGPNSNSASATTLATNPHLLAAYGFNEGSGTILTDLTGNGNAGDITSGNWTTSGKYGGGLTFNGTSTVVTIPDKPALRLSTGMTLEAWVKPNTATSAWRDVIYKGNDNYYLEAATQQNGVPAIGQIIGTSTYSEVYGPAPLAVNTWVHLAATYDAVTLRLYINGVEVGNRPQTGAMMSSTNPLQLGGDTFWGQNFSGVMDDVRIYDVALSPANIQADMNTPLGVNLVPDITMTKTHSTAFFVGQTGAQYTLTVTNSGQGVTTGQVTVSDSLPAGLTATDISGSGWACILTSLSCTRSDSLAIGASYPTVIVTVNVDANALPNLVNNATASGGGETNSVNNTASDPTLITTPDTQPPTAPGTLTATTVSGVQIDLTWGAATDNIGVSGYRVERCTGIGCSDYTKIGTTVPGTAFSDTGLAPSTNYGYIVRAQDAVGNLGSYSNSAASTTFATNPHLLAAYGFNEGTGTVLTDLTGNGNTGSIASGTWTTAGKYGGGLTFNGTSTRVTIADKPALHLSTGMTLEAWVKPNSVTSAWRDVIYKGDDNYYLESATQQNAAPAIGQIIGPNHSEVFALSALTLNTWAHLAATYDGATLRLYINGTEVGNRAQTGAMVSSANPLEIGGDSIYGQFFSGVMDDIRIYDVALTPSNIQADMNTPLGNTNLPLLSLSNTAINFGSQAVGTSTSPTTVTVTNTGNATLSITNIALSGPQGSDFSQTNTCSSPLAINGTCSVSITFTPTVVGSRNATVTITDNAPGTPHSIAVSGAGAGALISPKLTVLTPGQQQQFTASGLGGNVTWLVDGVVGGSTGAGTVTTAGLYIAPANAGSHTVAVTDSQLSASATAYTVTNTGVFTHHIDNARTGANTNEVILTPANVNSATFGKLYSYQTDGISHASPLYVAGVNMPVVGIKNVVYVSTEHDSIYAFDADGVSGGALWHRSFINPPSVTTVPNADTGECCDIVNEIGITGTPAIDTTTGTLYVVVKTKESGNYFQRLHALDITTGADKLTPVLIQATVTGSGTGSVGNQLAFDQLRESQRTALLLVNGIIYFGFGSHGDYQPYHGWIFAYNAATLQKVFAFCTTPNGEGGGVWHSGGGLIPDSSGNIYFITGDGSFDANTGGKDYGDSFVKLSPTGTVLDYFTPKDQGVIDANNLDLGAGGMISLPDQPGSHPHMLVSGGKNGSVYLVDRDTMGHFSSQNNTNVQTLTNIFPFGTPLPGNYSSPVYFNGKVYFGPISDSVQIFTLNNGLLSTSSTSRSVASYAYPGASLSVSANGTSNAILWATEKKGSSPGTLHAYDANNLQNELYHSDQAGTRDAIDPVAKFAVPLVVNGKVFLVTEGRMTVFGLLP